MKQEIEDRKFPCCYCKARLPRYSFYPTPGRSTGVSSGCVACSKANASTWNKNNKQKVLTNKKKCEAKTKKSGTAWRGKNREKLNSYMREWRKKNGYVARNRVRFMRQTIRPAWVNLFFVKEAYRLARLRTAMTGFAWQVDHIVPINSSLVCGLHVENNLRVIPAIENKQKGNRVWPDMPL